MAVREAVRGVPAAWAVESRPPAGLAFPAGVVSGQPGPGLACACSASAVPPSDLSAA